MNEKKGRLALLWEISRHRRLLYLCALLFMVIRILCNYLTPQIIRFVVDNVVGSAPATNDLPVRLLSVVSGVDLKQTILFYGLLSVAVALIGGLCDLASRRTLRMASEGMIKGLRDKLFRHIQYLPYEWHVKVQTGDIIQRCTSDVDVVRNFVTSQFHEMVRTIILVVFAYCILFPMNPVMAGASLAFLPVMFAYSFIFMSLVSKRFLAADEAEGGLLSIAQENFTGVRVVRAFGRERYEVDRFEKQNNFFSGLWIRLGRLLSVYWSSGDLITGLQMVTICVLGAHQATQGNITVGSFIVFLTYNSMTIWPVRGLGRILSEFSKTGVSLGRIQEILHTPVETDPEDTLTTPVDGDIVFDHVSFSYDGQKVLDDVSFTVEKGTTLGILGSTGSGKTTVVHLLCRLYDLENGNGSGTISVGGTDVRKFRRGWLRENVGIVLQEPFLYSRSIKENIAALSEDYPLKEIHEAARISCVDDSIRQFAHGYDTVVGERGVTLSGGQKQRVAIARTVLKKPPIMIFDDSLSAVDTETDLRIRTALAGRTSDVTTLIIAHRITSLSRADKIIVLDSGRLLEMGTHEELMALGGVYRRVHDMQESIETEVGQLPSNNTPEVEPEASGHGFPPNSQEEVKPKASGSGFTQNTHEEVKPL